MSLPFSADELRQHIQHDTQHCQALLALLNREQDALKKRDAEQVEAILKQKTPLIEAFEKSLKRRQDWASKANMRCDEEAWSTLLAKLNASDIAETWTELKQLYRRVHEQNDINGRLLSRHQSTAKRMLDILRGKTAGPNLYTANGYSSNRADRNNIGEA